MSTITAMMAGMKPGEIKLTAKEFGSGKNWWIRPWFKDAASYWHCEAHDGKTYQYRDNDHNWVAYTEPSKFKRYYKFVIQNTGRKASFYGDVAKLGMWPIESGEYFPDEATCIKSWADAGYIVKVLKKLEDRHIDVEAV